MLANADLYREFFDLYRQLTIEIIWIKGHTPSSSKEDKHMAAFSLLDNHVRKTLRATVDALALD